MSFHMPAYTRESKAARYRVRDAIGVLVSRTREEIDALPWWRWLARERLRSYLYGLVAASSKCIDWDDFVEDWADGWNRAFKEGEALVYVDYASAPKDSFD